MTADEGILTIMTADEGIRTIMTADEGILSFTINPTITPSNDFEIPSVDPELGSIEETLLEAIRAQVKKDGIDPKSIQEGQIEQQVYDDAVAQIYFDVTGFYDWYFNPDDDRPSFLINQDKVVIPSGLRDAVKPVVDDNLEAMREVNEIPTGLDTEGLNDIVTDALSRYILNWEKWYYDRKKEEEIDNYFEQKSFYDEIYIYSDYGQLSNLLDEEQYDGISDVPWIGEPLFPPN